MKKRIVIGFVVLICFSLILLVLNLPRGDTATSISNVILNSSSKTSYNVSDVKFNNTLFNRYVVKYSSDVNVKGILTYKVNGKIEKERFFLEPSSSGTFSSFINGYIDNVSVNKLDLVSVEFENIDSKQGKISVTSIEMSAYKNVNDLISSINGSLADSSYSNQKTIFLGSNNIKLGLSLKYGGSINYIVGNSKIFSSNNSGVNVVNSYDNGRLIQQCLYGNKLYSGNNDRYISGVEDNIDGMYNPIQGGNVNHKSKIVDIVVSSDKKKITIKTKPTLWRVSNSSYMNLYNDYYGGYAADAYMITEYSIYDTYISVKNSYIDFTNNVNNTNNGSARSESPSVYTVASLEDFYIYNMTSKKPEKQKIGSSINGFRNLNPDSNNNGQAMYSYWGGYFSTNGDVTEGLGIYRPDYDGSYQYFHGFIAGSSNSKSSLDSSTSFFTSIIHLNNNRLKQFKKTSYDYVITLGNINNVKTIMNKYRDDHSYTLKVNPNGGKFNNSTSQITLSPNLLPYWGNWNNIGVSVRNGYTLDGYYTSQTGGTKVYDKNGLAVSGSYWKVTNHDKVEEKYQYIGNKNLVVYARWKPITYSISYNLDGGSVSNPTTYNPDSSDITLKNPAKKGYTFAGWTGTGLSGVIKTVVIKKGSVGDRTYKATWEKNKYTITYNANGGSVSTSSQSVLYDSKINTLPTATRKGYNFLGWYTDKTGGEKIQTTTVYKYTNNITLYARWSDKQTYTITYDGNGSTDKISSEIKEVNSTYSPLPTPTKKGYKLLGWYTDKTGGTKVNNTDKVVGNKTIYARWEIINYTIKYNLNGSSVSNQTSYNVESETFTLKNPTKKGYVFDGWKDESSGVISKIVKIEKGSVGDKTYSAIFRKESESVKPPVVVEPPKEEITKPDVPKEGDNENIDIPNDNEEIIDVENNDEKIKSGKSMYFTLGVIIIGSIFLGIFLNKKKV